MAKIEHTVRVKRGRALAAHTILEAVVSLTIASMVFTLGFMIYLNVVRSLDQEYQVYLQNEAGYHLDSLVTLHELEEHISYMSWNALQVNFELAPYEDYEHAWLGKCQVTDSLFNQAVSRKIIYWIPKDETE